MYTGHFGLDDGPFRGKAEGPDVYIGPQQAAIVARLRKTLAAEDTAVAVHGPVGVGKTTLVRHAIAQLRGTKIVVPVDRIRLEPDEVLDLLLARFEVSRPPRGTIQRVAAFRRLLEQRLSEGVRVLIVIEDAGRVGQDALIEIEALTATDGGAPVGANIVLMGGESLSELLARPALARLRQRIRLRQAVTPFDCAEVEGYMRHCLEAAGGVLEQIFEPGTPFVVHRYSGGIARVIDNLCEAALVAAAEAGLATILPEFLEQVAWHCGLEPQATDIVDVAGHPVDRTVGDQGDDCIDQGIDEGTDQGIDQEVDDRIGQEIDDQDDDRDDGRTDKRNDNPGDNRTDDSADHIAGGNLAIALPLTPDTVEPTTRNAPADDRAELATKLATELATDLAGCVDDAGGDEDIPTLSDSMRVAVLPWRRMNEVPSMTGGLDAPPFPTSADEARSGLRPEPATAAEEAARMPAEIKERLFVLPVPDTPAPMAWDESTLDQDAATDVFVDEKEADDAGEGPEIDALQAAIQAANAWHAEDADDGKARATAERGQEPDDIPAIVLDAELERRKPPSADLDRLADEASKARSLEDMSDVLAETIFGNEAIEAISAGIRAAKPAQRANTAREAPVVPRAAPALPVAGRGPAPKAMPARPASPPAKVSTGSTALPPGRGISMTMSQRIEMVNSLNGRRPPKFRGPLPGGPVAEIVLAEDPDESLPRGIDAPAPIEAQIDTAITQSRKALSQADLARLASSNEDDAVDDGGDRKASRGLLGFFRRSSKS